MVALLTTILFILLVPRPIFPLSPDVPKVISRQNLS